MLISGLLALIVSILILVVVVMICLWLAEKFGFSLPGQIVQLIWLIVAIICLLKIFSYLGFLF